MNLHTARHAFSVGVVSLTLATTVLRAQKIEISLEKIVDLTYDFDATTVYWPNAKSFDWQKEYWDMSPRGYWYAAGHYSASEHGGTHTDGSDPLFSRWHNR